VRFGYGIRNSILARVAEVGGAASIDSHPGQGTRVDLRWPA
jgi:signal transduction histidine kinase